VDARFPYVAIKLAVAAALFVLAVISWRRRHTRGAVELMFLCLALAVWTSGSATENAQTNLEAALFWGRVKYFGLLLMPPGWLIFTLRYTGRMTTLSPQTLALLSIHPILSLLLIWTTESHGLYWSSYRIATEQTPAMFDAGRGPLYWVVTAYVYALVLYGTGIMLQFAWNRRRVYRAQSLLIAAAVLAPLAANILFLANLIRIPGFDPTPVAFGMSCLIIAFGLLRFRLLDLIPIARDLIIENMNDAILVLDDEQRVVDLNPAMETILGGGRAEIGKPVEELYARHPQLRASEDDTPFLQGSRYYERHSTVIRDRQRRAQGALIIFHDVSERQQTELALNTRVQQLATLQRVDEALTNKLDVEYVLTIAIDAAMDLSRADTGGIAVIDGGEVRLVHTRGRYSELLTDEYPVRTSGIVARVIRDRQPVLIHDVSTAPDYVPVIAETRAQITIPLVSRETVVGVLNLETEHPERFTKDVFDLLQLIMARVAVALDNARLYQLAQQRLAELQTLYDKVRYLELLKTDMIRIAAHDLRNPIHLINTYIELLQDDLRDVLDEQQQQFLASIKRASTQMLRITNSVLSPERIEQSAATMQIVDLRTLAEEIYLAHKDQARQKHLIYEAALPEAPLRVNGDAVQLGEALTNLIVNAIKYTPDGGRILFSLTRNRSRAEVRIEDTGFGIPLEQQEKLFQPFFRAEMSETQNIEGTGLGLHLVKNIVERHFGKVYFQSAEGAGSTFGFELPIIQSL
jgi:signal transduction histidine kinase